MIPTDLFALSTLALGALGGSLWIFHPQVVWKLQDANDYKLLCFPHWYTEKCLANSIWP